MDERVFVCPKCNREPMIAWQAHRLPVLPFIYTCPHCKAETHIAFNTPPPVQPTDPANKQVEEKVA